MKNRVIKFRIWDAFEQAFMTPENDGTNAAISLDGTVCMGYIDGDMSSVEPDDYVPIEQFTGLLDKNGKEIYEGDILKESNGTIITIEWNHSAFAARWISGPSNQNLISYFTDCWMDDVPKNSEIIGNVHQNKDLLK